jgi:hypothetical protein
MASTTARRVTDSVNISESTKSAANGRFSTSTEQ